MHVRSAYANITSTLALVVALGSGGAYAAQLAKDSVTTKQIKDGTIRVVDLGDGSVTAAKLAPGAVPNQLTDGSVSTSKLADGAVTSAKLAPGAIPNASIPDGSITGPKLADGAVGSGKIADGAVGSNKIPDGAINSGKVADNSLSGTDIDESSLGKVPTAGQADFATRSETVLAAAARADGTLLGSHSYRVTTVQRQGTGQYIVTFTRDLAFCTYVASPTKIDNTTDDIATSAVALQVAGNGSQVLVHTWFSGGGGTSLMDSGFSVIVVC